MLGAISGAILLDIAKRGGYMEQLDLLDPVPFIEIDLKYLSNVTVDYRW